MAADALPCSRIHLAEMRVPPGAQEEIIPFFQGVQLSADSKDVFSCYVELAEKVRAGLSHLDPYFNKLADGMIAWIESWQKLNP